MCLALGLGIAHLRQTNSDPLSSEEPPAVGAVLTVGQRELTAAELSYYYWSEYYYHLNSGAAHLPEKGVSLSEQAYDETRSWHDYFLDAAIETAREDLALGEAGKAEGFTLPEVWQTELDSVKEKFSEYAAAGGFFLAVGEPDVDGYLQSSYGKTASKESFFRYLDDTYYAAAYADRLYYSFTFSDEQVEEFFRLHSAAYAEEGLAWNEACPVRIAYALFVPETGDEAGWDAARERAEEMSLAWHTTGGEEAFVALGRALTFDTPATERDSWHEPAWCSPSDRLDETLRAWCFEPLRQVNDYAFLELDEGLALVLFCQRAERTDAYSRAEEDLRYETYRSELIKIVEGCGFSVRKDKIVLAEPLQDEK